MKESLYFPIFGYLISLTGIFLLSLFTSPPPPPLVSLFRHVIFDSLIHCVACLRFPWKQKGEDKMDFWNASREDSAFLLLNIYTKWEELEVNLCTLMYFSSQLITPKALCKSICMYFVTGKAETELHWWNLKSNSPLTPRPPSSSPHNSELSQGGNEGGAQWPRADFEPSLNSSLWRGSSTSWVSAFCFHSVGPVKSICSNKLVTPT